MQLSFRPLFLSAALLVSLGHAVQAAPEGFHKLAIGETAPDFTLPGVDGKTYSLSDFADKKLLIVVFTCNHCPTAQAYEERIIKLHEDCQKWDSALIAISPNDDAALRLDELGFTDVGDSFEDMKIRAKDRNFQFPYLYDGDTQKVAAAYGVVATPQIFVFDQQRKLRYVGRIDDSDVREVKSHDARNAIDAILVNKPVPVETTRTYGCSTKWSEKRAEAIASLEKWNQEPVEIQSLNEADLAKLMKNDTENYLLIDVWATWCGPCVAELPEIVKMKRMYQNRNFQVVTISMDEPDQKEAALKLLKKNHVAGTNYHLSIQDRDKFAELLDKEWAGPVPYLLLVAPGGKIVYRKQEAFDPLTVKKVIVEHLGRTYASRKK